MEGKMQAAITSIMLNSRTYHNVLVTPTLINFFYGKNGVGKSTIADCIRSGAGVSPSLSAYEVLVYDRAFIDQNIRAEGMSGVFSVNEGNIRIQDEIKEKAEGIEEKLNIDTDELKNETKDTVNQVKEVFSNGDFKEKTTETTHFVRGAFTDPFETIEEIATEKNEVFSKTVLLILLFVILSFATSVFGVFRVTHFNFLTEFSSFISSITTPVLFILVPSIVIYLFNIKNRRKMTTVISTITTCYIPIIIASACMLLRKIVPDLAIVTNPVILTCKALSIIFLTPISSAFCVGTITLTSPGIEIM